MPPCQAFPEVFAGACAALRKEIYETGHAQPRGWEKPLTWRPQQFLSFALCLLQCTVMCSTHSCAALTILLNQIKGKRADTNPKNTPSEPTGEVIFAPGGFSVALHITTTGLLLQANGDGSKPTIGVWATILMLRGLWCDPWFCIGSELVLTFWGLTTLGWCYFFWIRVLRSERVL